MSSPDLIWAARDVVAGYGSAPVLEGVGIEVRGGETVGLAGPSGCGKTTLGRVLALLHRPDAGTVEIDGAPVPGFRHRASRGLRTRVGMVFQQPRLAIDPRMTLRATIAEPLRANRLPVQVAEIAERVGLTPDLLGRRPHEVSDGQLQRAGLARALVLRPAYLLCDEMTTMLDASTTATLVGVIREYQADTGCAVLAVSHDGVLLGRWADRIVQMHMNGRSDSVAA
ncbi:ABC transporter ATP-binding protein [Pseudonocardia sp.]|uniref:ABC transporter ATP-binding protein n=1 Tax=Pseudonocardia sp. TaxID=60912 RepID=UPI003D119619